MPLTSTNSSWAMSKVVESTVPALWSSPANRSAYERATRAGVSRSHSRSGSSPTAASSSRTAAITRGWSTATSAALLRALTGARLLPGRRLLGAVGARSVGGLPGLDEGWLRLATGRADVVRRHRTGTTTDSRAGRHRHLDVAVGAEQRRSVGLLGLGRRPRWIDRRPIG